MSWLDSNKYLILGLVTALTALVYALGDAAVRVAAVMRPSVRTVVINRVVKQNNIREVVREIVRHDGTREVETTRVDLSTTNTQNDTSHESTPVAPGSKYGWYALGGGGRDLGGTYHGAVGGGLGPICAWVDNPVYPYELNPRLTVAYLHRF